MEWNKTQQAIRARSNYSSQPRRIIGKKYEVFEKIGAGVLGTCYKIKKIDDQSILVAKEISIHNRNTSDNNGELTVTDGFHGHINK